MSFRLSVRKILTGIIMVSAIAILLQINTTNVIAQDRIGFESFEGLSVGEAWDLRYGNGEVTGDYMGTWTIANCNDFASMYEQPDEVSEIVISVPKWTDVEAYYYNGDWFECDWNGQHGYILRQFLTDRPGKYVDYPGNSAE